VAATLKHLSMHVSDVHLCAELQHGQSDPMSPMFISAFAVWVIAVAAATGRIARPAISITARMNRKLRIAIKNYSRDIARSIHGFVDTNREK